MTTFKELGLSDEILKVLKEIGFEKPSKIQREAIPRLMEGGTDLIGLAQTGTGKTAAFGLPLLEHIDPSKKHTQALVLAPTRELGKQIAEQLHQFSKYLKKVNVLAVYGGAYIGAQIKALQKTQHVIIATPGRLIDLIERKAVKLDKLEVLVLDEADEMLNMGFKDELDKILSYTPEEKHTWLFSATMPHEIKRMVNTYMNDPVEIRINAAEKVNTNIEHQFTIVRRNDKAEALTRFLDVEPNMRGVVFCRTRMDTRDLAEILLGKNYKADALHGDLSQNQRDRVMRRFKEHDLQVLIATDVAARGIDVADLTHVFHHTLPDDASYYTHRSGRTARAGRKGISIAFIGGRDGGRIRTLERQLGISFKKVPVPQASEIAEKRVKSWCFEILEKEPKDKIDLEILESATTIFENLSKEELLAKVLLHELEKMNLDSNKDLNDEERRGGGRGDRRRGGGGGGGRGRDRDRRRSRDRDRRSGGGGGGGRGRDFKKSKSTNDTRTEKPKKKKNKKRRFL